MSSIRELTATCLTFPLPNLFRLAAPAITDDGMYIGFCVPVIDTALSWACFPFTVDSFLAPGRMFDFPPGGLLSPPCLWRLVQVQPAQLTIFLGLGLELASFSFFLLFLTTTLAHFVPEGEILPKALHCQDENVELVVG